MDKDLYIRLLENEVRTLDRMLQEGRVTRTEYIPPTLENQDFITDGRPVLMLHPMYANIRIEADPKISPTYMAIIDKRMGTKVIHWHDVSKSYREECDVSNTD